uniref:FYVE-type domain-containing protein n=1 Tax=Phytophthora ramorum TaxID=164328 RepID=H3H2A4_PHYRM
MLGSRSDRSRPTVASFKSGLKRLGVERSWHDSWDRATKVVDSEADQDPLSNQSRVQLGDNQLVDLARDATDKVDFRRLTNRQASLRNWKWKPVANGFTAFSHGDGLESAQEVMATGEMKASLNELSQILSTTTDNDHEMVMRSLYKDYIHGAVVHTVTPSLGSSSSSAMKADVESRLAVKTSAFERSRMFKNHEQWCFLEYYEKQSSADAFTVTLTSVPERDLLAGKMKADRVDELPGLTAAYLIEKIPSSNSVRVVFFAEAALHEEEPQFDQSASNMSYSQGSDSSRGNQLARSKKREKRLMRLAAGASQLPEVVRRRRFGTQQLANCSSFEAKNSRCTCCAKSLRMLTRKKRCHICGYMICHQCWSIHSLETSDGRVSSVRACTRCIEFVDNADYSRVDQKKRGLIGIIPDSAAPASNDPPGKALTNFLHDALENSSGNKRKSVMSVVRHLLNQEKENEDVRSECSSVTSSVRLTDDDAKKYSDALDKGMLLVDTVPVEECVLANTQGRNYPLNMAADVATMSKPPMPKDEHERISSIEKGGFSKITDTEELDLICELLAREMKCSTGLVTLISEDEQHVLASNVVPFRQLHMPREQSFCQHTIMNDEPLLVPHPESDIRFQNLPALHAYNLNFYLGFPLKDENDRVVGSVCCIDDTSREVTQSQYSSMKKLAETASKVVQIKGKQAARMSDPTAK